MPESPVALRAAWIERWIPRAPMDVLPLRASFSAMVAGQRERHLAPVLSGGPLGSGAPHAAKMRFIAEMYARACYSMLLVSAHGPWMLRAAVRTAAHLPLSRRAAVRCGNSLLSSLNHLVPPPVHRQIALMAALMGVMDVVLDETAMEGQDAVLGIASLLSSHPRTAGKPLAVTLGTLAQSVRKGESQWQAAYWENVLLPAVREYCTAEALAVKNVPDPTGLGHRWPGIDAAIKGMWYAVGPSMGLGSTLDGFQQPLWNREQRWMADTSLLMQMIDDWVDQDEDRGMRPTPVLSGCWGPESIGKLYARTAADLAALLDQNRIHNQVLKNLIGDLYTDYLHTAVEAMRSGLAA